MHIFIPAYVLLALASWSALAAPLSGSQRYNRDEPAQKRSLSSSVLTGRQQQISDFGPGLETLYVSPPDDSDQPTMDCDHKSKHKDGDHNGDDHKDGDNTDDSNTGDSNTSDSNTGDGNTSDSNTGDNNTDQYGYGNLTPVLPTIARRRFRSPMRRDSKVLSSIFERDDPPRVTTREPITVGDIVANYMKQRAASRKRAMRPKTSRGAK